MKPEDIALSIEPAWGEIVLSIIEEARRRFDLCGATSDFCLQSSGLSTLVFGGTNRVIWNPSGFECDWTYCTDRFRSAWAANFDL